MTGLKVIDGTPTSISKWLRKQEEKEKMKQIILTIVGTKGEKNKRTKGEVIEFAKGLPDDFGYSIVQAEK